MVVMLVRCVRRSGMVRWCGWWWWRLFIFMMMCILLVHHSTSPTSYLLIPIPPTNPTYNFSPPPATHLNLLTEEGDTPDGRWPWRGDSSQLTKVSDYFRYLRTPQVSCGKIVRFGGTLNCRKGNGDYNNMDGHKYLCLDVALELPVGRHPHQCLTLSFGTHLDTTFDDAVSELPCEVHMFDVLDFDPQLPKEVNHVYFHTEGIGASDHTLYFGNINRSAHINTLSGHVTRLGLHTRLIHVLKIDIEGGEWDVLKELAEDPILDAVGQLSLEVHCDSLVAGGPMKDGPPDVPREAWLRALQERHALLSNIESRGFRRVAYWANQQESLALVDDDGATYETAGELLYVNTNWYYNTFRRQLQHRGYRLSHLEVA